MNTENKFALTGVVSLIGMILCNCSYQSVITSLLLRLIVVFQYPSEVAIGSVDLIICWMEPNLGSWLQISMNCSIMSSRYVSNFLLLQFITTVYYGHPNEFLAVCVLPIFLRTYISENKVTSSLFTLSFMKVGDITRDILGLWSPSLNRFIYLNKDDFHLELELFQLLRNLQVQEDVPFTTTLDERFSSNQTFIRLKVNCIKVGKESYYLILGTCHNISRYSRMFLEAMTHELRTPLHIMLGILENASHEHYAGSLSDKLTVCKNCVVTVSTIVDNLIECCEKASPNNQEEVFRLIPYLTGVLSRLRRDHKFESDIEFDYSIVVKAKKLLMKKLVKSIFNFLKRLNTEDLIHVSASFIRRTYDCLLDLKFEVAVFNKEYIEKLFNIVQKLYKDSLETTDNFQDFTEGIFLLSSYYALAKQFASRLNAELNITILENKLQIRVTQSMIISADEVADSDSSLSEGIIAAVNETIILKKANSVPHSGCEEEIPFERDKIDVLKSSFVTEKVNRHSMLALKRKLLIVEDIGICAEILMKYVNKLGLDFKWAKHGQEAIEMILSEKFDLILMDYMMPVLNGIEATKKIREIEKYNQMKSIPIIGITANSALELENECINSGMNEVLSKPLPFKLLKERLGFYIGKLA